MAASWDAHRSFSVSPCAVGGAGEARWVVSLCLCLWPYLPQPTSAHLFGFSQNIAFCRKLSLLLDLGLGAPVRASPGLLPSAPVSLP